MPVERPHWLTKKAPSQSVMAEMESLLNGLSLHTVCQSALCPNIGECFACRTATFLIMGDVCTRNCRFCAIKKGTPLPLDPTEPSNVARAIKQLNLKHAVITSVTRDDLPDGGASHFADTVIEIRKSSPDTTTEVLVPDFRSSEDALKTVVDSSPQVINHNVETVPRLYPEARPMADYRRSLDLLKTVGTLGRNVLTKSGLMLGLGEEREEVISVMEDLRAAGCDAITIGQYLAPSAEHHIVIRYVPPAEFEGYKTASIKMGFRYVASAPFVRSSFRASELLEIPE